jgi:N12 class adenine-specific DNA methylase
VFTDPDRTERLVRIYNDTYNNLRPRLFDGSHLDFPGMNQAITLRPHQNDAVWRGMSSATRCWPTSSAPARPSRWPPPA